MTTSASINEEFHAIGARKIWLTRPFQPGTAANRPSSNRIGPLAIVRNILLAHKADPNQPFPGGEAFTWEIPDKADPSQLFSAGKPLLGKCRFNASTLRDMARFGMIFTPSWNKVSKERIVPASVLKMIQTTGTPEMYGKGYVGKTI